MSDDFLDWLRRNRVVAAEFHHQMYINDGAGAAISGGVKSETAPPYYEPWAWTHETAQPVCRDYRPLSYEEAVRYHNFWCIV